MKDLDRDWFEKEQVRLQLAADAEKAKEETLKKKALQVTADIVVACIAVACVRGPGRALSSPPQARMGACCRHRRRACPLRRAWDLPLPTPSTASKGGAPQRRHISHDNLYATMTNTPEHSRRGDGALQRRRGACHN